MFDEGDLVLKRKIDVLYVVSSLKKCGPTNQLFSIIKNLDPHQFQVSVLTLYNEPVNSDFQRFIQNNITVDSLKIDNKNNYLKIIKALKNFCKDKKIHIIHSSGLAADFTCSFVSKVIHISTIRNYAYFDYISAYGKTKGRIMIYLNKWAIYRTDHPVCCSKSIKLLYKDKIKKPLRYIQNGVDIEKFNYIPEVKKNDKEKLNLPIGKQILLVSGSLTDRKDPLFIIKNFISSNIAKSACLLFIGEGDLYEECKKYQSENIIFRGNVDNVNDFLKVSNYYISASKSEGLPNSVLEAGASGVNLILSDIPQHKEIFEEEPNLASFFVLGDGLQFRNLLNKTVKQNNQHNVILSNHIISNFSSIANSKQYASLYKKVI